MVKYRRVKVESPDSGGAEGQMSSARRPAMSLHFYGNPHQMLLDWDNMVWKPLVDHGELAIANAKIQGSGRAFFYEALGEKIDHQFPWDRELPHWALLDLDSRTATPLDVWHGPGLWERPLISLSGDLSKFAYLAIWHEEADSPATLNELQYPTQVVSPKLKMNAIRVQDLSTGRDIELARAQGSAWLGNGGPGVLWSLDGTKVAGILPAMFRVRPGAPEAFRPDIHFFDVQTGKTEWVLENHFFPTDAAWSHDGTRLIVACAAKTGFGVFTLATQEVTWYDPNNGVDPVSRPDAFLLRVLGFAPDGRVYCWARLARTAVVVLLDLETGEREELFRTSGCPDAWLKLAQVPPEFLPMPAQSNS